MVKKKERNVNVSGNPKHSLDANRRNDAKKVNLKKERNVNQSLNAMEMRAVRRRFCKRVRPSSYPPAPWSKRAENKVVNLELFPGLQSRMSSNYNVHQKQKQKQSNSNSRVQRPFTDVFGSKTKRKRPCLLAFDYESLAKKAHVAQDAFEEKDGASGTAEANEADGMD